MPTDLLPIPFRPCNGRVLIRQLPYKPSKIVQIFSGDRADENEGIVVALSPHRFGRKILGEKHGRRKGDTVMTNQVFPHDLKLGDRVFFRGSYQNEDTMTFNGVKHRCLDSWEILGVMDSPQPEGYENAVTGERTPDSHPLLFTA